MEYIAHRNPLTNRTQTVEEHCGQTAQYAEGVLSRVKLSKVGYLAGLLHDAGKFSKSFQKYIREDIAQRGSVIHTFQGCRLLLERYHQNGVPGYESLTCELLAFAIAAHHGLFDCVDEKRRLGFAYRLDYYDEEYDETVTRIHSNLLNTDALDVLFTEAHDELAPMYEKISAISEINTDERTIAENIEFYMGLLGRLILSAVIEGDRRDTAVFMMGETLQEGRNSPEWEKYLQNVENSLSAISADTPIDKARQRISRQCRDAAKKAGGVFSLNIPTGAGKTLSSLRYALTHAAYTGKDRIIFAVPLLSILEQNAAVIRNALGDSSAILEHHSNVVRPRQEPEKADRQELLTESWDAPIIITTLVQLLNTLFDGKTSCIRRFHALCNSVIIIDEVQTIPPNMLSLFNMAVNFLSETCGTTFVLCSATQPCFTKATRPLIHQPQELIPYDEALWKPFQRTVLQDAGAYKLEDIPAFLREKITDVCSLLVVCNKKSEAEYLFREVRQTGIVSYHLSASMCIAHRQITLDAIQRTLAESRSGGKKVIVVSTQVIEAGVDISFERVIRLQAGMDSIVQAAGRCNRNGEDVRLAPVYILNCTDEHLGMLSDIQAGKAATTEVLTSFRQNPARYGNSLSSKESIDEYYQTLYRNMSKGHQDFKVGKNSIFDLLSVNEAYADADCPHVEDFFFRQAFKKAGQLFRVFDDSTETVVVPFGEGKGLIAEWNSMNAYTPLNVMRDWMRRAKPYTISLYQWQKERLGKGICENNNVLFLQDSFYDNETGLCLEQKEITFLEV